MKEKIKKWICEIIYQLYRHHILNNKLEVASIEETIAVLQNSDKSIVRYGDAEIRMVEGHSVEFQKYDAVLAERLQNILQFNNDKLLVGIPDIFSSLEMYTDRSKQFWKEHLLFSRRTYEKYCNKNKKYYNAFISRMYYIFEDKKQCEIWFQNMKQIWENKEILVVEGEVSHNGVGNDLFDNAKKIERIICPSRNAFFSYAKILNACLMFPKETLILSSIGNTAKVLAQDLVEAGYRVIDIGNLDMEYEWFLKRVEEKSLVLKHKITGVEANQKAGYYEYLEQVKIWIS